MKSPIARRCAVFAFAAILLIASTAVAQSHRTEVFGGFASPKQALEIALERLQGQEAGLKVRQARLRDAEQERDELLTRQTSLREALIEHQMPPESVAEVLSKLALALIDVEVELHGKRGRLEAIEQAIAVQAAQSRREVDQDEALAKLKEIVELRQVALARASAAWKAGVAGEVDLQRAQADLAVAELRLAVRKGELADEPMALTALNEQLLETTIDAAELESRRKYISGRLVAVRPFVELCNIEPRLKQVDERISVWQNAVQRGQVYVEEGQQAVEERQQRVEQHAKPAPPSAKPPVEQRPPSDPPSEN